MLGRGLSRLGVLLALTSCGTDKELSDTETESDVEIDAITDVSVRVLDDYQSLVEVTWIQHAAGTVTIDYVFGLEDETGSSPELTLEAGTWRQIVVGIPYEQDFLLDLTWTGEGGTFTTPDQAGSTGTLPEDMPTVALMEAQSDGWDDSKPYVLGSVNATAGGWVNGTFWNWIIDRDARVIWAHEVPRGWSLYPQRSQDGTHLLLDGNTFWSAYDEGADSTVKRMLLDGTELEEISLVGLHHSFLELSDGSFIWGAASWTTETLDELSPDGVQRTVWECDDFLAEMGARSTCQSNSMFHNEADDTVLFSFYTLEEIIEIDRTTGASLRAFGRLEGSWAFDPPESEFIWQHGPSYTEEGNLLVSSKSPDETETVVYEYALDEDNETLTEVWSFGIDEGVLARTDGEAHRLPNGNTLHNYGSAGRLREVTPEGEVVWDINWKAERLIGRTTFQDDLYGLLNGPEAVEEDSE